MDWLPEKAASFEILTCLLWPFGFCHSGFQGLVHLSLPTETRTSTIRQFCGHLGTRQLIIMKNSPNSMKKKEETCFVQTSVWIQKKISRLLSCYLMFSWQESSSFTPCQVGRPPICGTRKVIPSSTTVELFSSYVTLQTYSGEIFPTENWLTGQLFYWDHSNFKKNWTPLKRKCVMQLANATVMALSRWKTQKAGPQGLLLLSLEGLDYFPDSTSSFKLLPPMWLL